MQVRYRVIEKLYRGEGWRPWGVLYENCSGRFPEAKVLIRSIPDDDRQTARHMGRRIVELEIDIESQIELVDESYPIRFRVSHTIHWVEGEDYRAIRQRLWDALFDAMRAREVEKEEQPAEPLYAPQPTYHVAREAAENGGNDAPKLVTKYLDN